MAHRGQSGYQHRVEHRLLQCHRFRRQLVILPVEGGGDPRHHQVVQILIFLAALQDIPPSIYEAARVDSADSWESFWLVTLPMLAPMIQLNLVYTVLATFSMADNEVLEFIQWLAFESGDVHGYEYSCAVSWIYCVFVLLVVGLLVLLTRRFVDNVKDRS